MNKEKDNIFDETKYVVNIAKKLSKKIGRPVSPTFGHPDYGKKACWYFRVWCKSEDFINSNKYEGYPIIKMIVPNNYYESKR